MANREPGMADHFLRRFGSELPDQHPARSDLVQSMRFGKEKHEAFVAYELADLTVDWLQELVAKEGGDAALLDNLPAPTQGLHARRKQIEAARAVGPLSAEAGAHALATQECLADGRFFAEAERAGACFHALLVGRDSRADALADEAVLQAQALYDLGSRRDAEDTARSLDHP